MNEELPGGNEFWEELSKKYPQGTPQTKPTYELALFDPGSNDGYRMVFHTIITIYDFANLLREHFGIEVDLTYSEDGDETLIVDRSPLDSLIQRLREEDDE